MKIGARWAVVLNVFGFVIILVAWFLLSRFHLVPYLRSPMEVAAAYAEKETPWAAFLLATFLRSFTGFFLGSAIGIVVALAMSWSDSIRALVDPWIFVIKPIPVLALIPMFILWFGIGEWTKVLYIAMGCFFIIVVESGEAIKSVPVIYLWAGSALGTRKADLFSRIVLPAIVPSIIGGLRLAATAAPSLTLAAEFMNAKYGLGYYSMTQAMFFRVDRMLAATLLIVLIAIVMDYFVRVIDRFATSWTERQRQ